MRLINKVKGMKNKDLTLYLTVLFSFPLVTLVMMEAVHRGSIIAAFYWGFEHIVPLLSTYVFLLSFIGILYCLPRRLFISLLFIQSITWIIIAFTSYKKYLLRGDYLSPFDVHLLREAVNITSFFGSSVTSMMILIAIFIGVAVIVGMLLFLRLDVNFSLTKRLMISAGSIIIFIVLVKYPVIFSLKEKDTVVMNEIYESIGFTGAFLSIRNQSDNYGLSKSYNKKNINQIDVKADNGEVDTEFRPNVIVVLAEALWDPLLLENVEFEEDPIPYFRSLTKEHTSGELLTHIFGGGTVNTELEILTGLTTRLLPEGHETYQQNIDRPLDSLAHVFKEQGYNTTAVHAFANWFYKRNEMYKWLGFEKYVSREFFNDPKHIGLYIDDHELMEQVLKELNKSEGPDFMQVNTVASHGPYEDIRYEELPEITKGDLSEESKYILDLYSQLLMELDDSIRLLIEGVEELAEPTMVVIYGDHLPMLGEDYSVYKEAGYYEGNKTYKEHLKMYTTPLLVWDNYSTQEREDLRMTPNFLGSYILSHAKKEKSEIFAITDDLYERGITVIPRKDFWKEEGVEEKDLDDYKLLQYDSLFGSQYKYEKNPVTAVESYFLGSEKMKIESATIKVLEDGKEVLDIIGEDFVFEAKVFIEGKEQNTTFISSSNIQSEIPEIYVSQEVDFTISVRVTDNINVVLSYDDFMVIR